MLRHRALLVSLIAMALFTVSARAATIAHWAFEDGTTGADGENLGGMALVDSSGNVRDGEYLTNFFGTGPETATGIDGVPATAVDFSNEKAMIQLPSASDANKP